MNEQEMTEVRKAVQDLVLSGQEVSTTTVQQALKEKGITSVPVEHIEPVLREEGGPYPEYRGTGH